MLWKTPHRNFDADSRVTGDLYYDLTAGLYLFSYLGKYFLSSEIGPSIDVDGDTFTTQYFTINGKNYWSCDGEYLFYDTAEGYVISSKLGYGLSDDYRWWKSSGGIEGNYIEQLPEESEEVPSVKIVSINPIAGWSSDSLLGVYTELDEFGEIVEGGTTKTVGLPRFKGDQEVPVYYTRSEVQYNEKYNYMPIRHDGTGWVIGNRGIDAWWEGDEPDVGASVTFEKKGTAEADIVIAFDAYVANTTRADVYVAEVSTYL